jgi:hypothetical protein
VFVLQQFLNTFNAVFAIFDASLSYTFILVLATPYFAPTPCFLIIFIAPSILSGIFWRLLFKKKSGLIASST